MIDDQVQSKNDNIWSCSVALFNFILLLRSSFRLPVPRALRHSLINQERKFPAAPSSPALCRLPCPRLPVVVRSSSLPFCGALQLPSLSSSDSVVENTKEYICRAVVTVVDHVGNVSANLDGLISQTNAFSDAELRIQCLEQGCSFIRIAWTRRSRSEAAKIPNRKSWKQRTDIHAKVMHQGTSKVISVATTNAKDLRKTLPSLTDHNACRVV